ncbi:LacI family DNA-binding transcriptional regulator [Microbacterium kunmingense]|uniref:LacI family DNA-binding transcriptional regulator n=1 Tax=Microbacterium kunmingense TaxID=2915939 RepID=UPI003D73B299
MATIRDVARHVGVSPATVSRVINGVPGFSAHTRERVEAAVAELGYEPDTLARGLRTMQSAVIGVLATAVSDALASQVMSGVESAARSRGYTVMLGRAGLGAEHAPSYLRSFKTYRAAGVVVISSAITGDMRRIAGARLPLMAVAIRNGDVFPSLAIDDEQAAYDGTRRLLELGHREIGLLAGDESSVLVNAPRERGYQRAMAEADAPALIERGNSLYDSAPPALGRLLERAPRLSAVFALSDEMGAAAINELQRRGRRVPEDVSVLGFDNTRTSQHVHPALSTVAQPLERMGEQAVFGLLDGTWRSRIFEHRLIERGSTASAPSPAPSRKRNLP